jgi:hypothetical protein
MITWWTQVGGRVANKREAATCAPDRRSASGYHVGRCALRKAETVEGRTELQKGDALAFQGRLPQPCQRSVVGTLKKL